MSVMKRLSPLVGWSNESAVVLDTKIERHIHLVLRHQSNQVGKPSMLDVFGNRAIECHPKGPDLQRTAIRLRHLTLLKVLSYRGNSAAIVRGKAHMLACGLAIVEKYKVRALTPMASMMKAFEFVNREAAEKELSQL